MLFHPHLVEGFRGEFERRAALAPGVLEEEIHTHGLECGRRLFHSLAAQHGPAPEFPGHAFGEIGVAFFYRFIAVIE